VRGVRKRQEVEEGVAAAEARVGARKVPMRRGEQAVVAVKVARA